MQAEPVQPARDIYSGAPAPGSNADQQQWLCTELCNSLHLREFSSEVGQWDSTGGFRSPCQLKQLTLNEVAMHTYPKKARTCLKMQLTHFYYSKCCMNNADHSYKQCLTWKFCDFCDKVRHWGFHCFTLHVKCMRLRCRVHIGHRHIGKMCLWSKETKVDNFCYSCDEQVTNLPHTKIIYKEGLDWSSYRLAI